MESAQVVSLNLSRSFSPSPAGRLLIGLLYIFIIIAKMSMLLSRHITEKIPEDRQNLKLSFSNQVEHPVIEYTDLSN